MTRQLSTASPLRSHSFAVLFALLLFLILTACGSDPKSGTSNATTLSSDKYDYGQVAVSTKTTRIATTVTNTSTAPQSVAMLLSGSPAFAINPDLSCEQTIAPLSSCNVVVSFQPSDTSTASSSLTVTTGRKDQTVSLTGNGVEVTAGNPLLTTTDNPLVAQYTVFAPAGASVTVEFGTDTNYGRTTSPQLAAAGEPVPVYVAGMRPNTTYHMRAKVSDLAGTVTTDSDRTFTTGAWTRTALPTVKTSTSAGMVPQAGVELLDVTNATDPNFTQAYATDLDGTLIWAYDFPDRKTDSIIQPIKQLPNGNFLLIISYASQQLVDGIPNNGEIVLLREIDLAGNPVRQITADQLNRKLQSAGFNLVAYDFHHDFAVLPNGHVVILANVLQPSSNGPAKSGTQNVVGDALVDLDTQFNPVWVWNSFDHLDLSRRPMGFPDWTHSNSILYTDDGNLLLSIRHQNWIIKVDYANGAGTGNVIWRLGPGGDFKLLNGNDPQDWFYAQHSPNFIGTRSSGVFSMILMDNGDDRVVSPGNACNGTSGPNCYTTVPVFSVDEAARTATLTFHKVFPPEQYSFWGGSANPLANGNFEFDLCAQPNTTSEINEVLPTGELVWKMTSTGANFYRGNRLPSLYPGVQW